MRPFSFHKSVKLLRMWEESHLFALNKPAQVLCHPNPNSGAGRYASILLDTPYDFEEEAFIHPEDGTKLWLLHRLDLGTSGVLLLSSDKETAERMKKNFRYRQVHKTYKALCFCRAKDTMAYSEPQAGDVWRDAMDQKGKKVTAETRLLDCKVLEGGMRLLTLSPKTGFQHQLRVQCAQRNLHIVGDEKHGFFPFNRTNKPFPGKRLYLHSESISFHYRGEEHFVRAPVEEEAKFLPNMLSEGQVGITKTIVSP